MPVVQTTHASEGVEQVIILYLRFQQESYAKVKYYGCLLITSALAARVELYMIKMNGKTMGEDEDLFPGFNPFMPVVDISTRQI